MTTIFISHASEDKDGFVRPLVHAMKRQGLKVWYDEFSLRLGDSLRRSIDKGLSECSAGIVILSPAFFTKEWPQRELDALLTGNIAGKSKLIPIWYNVDFSDVLAVSPLLADRFALNAQLGPEAIAFKIAEEFPPPAKFSGVAIAQLIEQYQYPALYAGEALGRGCQYRFLTMNAFKEDYAIVLADFFEKYFDDEIGDFPPQITKSLDAESVRLRSKYQIPEDVYLTEDEPVRESVLGSWMDDLAGWVSGTLSQEDSAKLVFDLDLAELDEYYILLGIPNFALSREQRFLLEQGLVEIGCGFIDEYEKVSEICKMLRRSDGNG